MSLGYRLQYSSGYLFLLAYSCLKLEDSNQTNSNWLKVDPFRYSWSTWLDEVNLSMKKIDSDGIKIVTSTLKFSHG